MRRSGTALDLASSFCKDHLACRAKASATFKYIQVPLLGEEARATYDRLTEKSASLPGREEAECRIKMWYSRRHEGYDLTRSDVLTIANAPGMGKTTLLLGLTTVLEGLVSETGEQRPVVVAFTYNAEMSKPIPTNRFGRMPTKPKGKRGALRCGCSMALCGPWDAAASKHGLRC